MTIIHLKDAASKSPVTFPVVKVRQASQSMKIHFSNSSRYGKRNLNKDAGSDTGAKMFSYDTQSVSSHELQFNMLLTNDAKFGILPPQGGGP